MRGERLVKLAWPSWMPWRRRAPEPVTLGLRVERLAKAMTDAFPALERRVAQWEHDTMQSVSDYADDVRALIGRVEKLEDCDLAARVAALEERVGVAVAANATTQPVEPKKNGKRMKSRKVLLMVEVETDLPLRELRSRGRVRIYLRRDPPPGAVAEQLLIEPLQVQANVVRAPKATPRAKGKRGKR